MLQLGAQRRVLAAEEKRLVEKLEGPVELADRLEVDGGFAQQWQPATVVCLERRGAGECACRFGGSAAPASRLRGSLQCRRGFGVRTDCSGGEVPRTSGLRSGRKLTRERTMGVS